MALHAEADGDHGLSEGDQHDEPVALDEVPGADAEPSDCRHRRTRPVQHERGHPQRPAGGTVHEPGGEQHRRGHGVVRAQAEHRPHRALLAGPEEEAGVHERDDEVADPEGHAGHGGAS